MTTEPKKLFRNLSKKMIGGVCAGIADYFSVDATIIRLAWILFCCLGGAGIIAYIICLLVIPAK
jgi:phage shock protein C